MRDHDELFSALATSKFRSRFRLRPDELRYLADKGLPTVLEHAREFVEDRLAPANPANDGRQTPMRGHPVFVAQHATATCCRSCLAKWHAIAKGALLSSKDIQYVVGVIGAWIERHAAVAKCDDDVDRGSRLTKQSQDEQRQFF